HFSSNAASWHRCIFSTPLPPDSLSTHEEACPERHFTGSLVRFSDAPGNFLPSCGEWFRMNECSFTE
ncbi:hypothetical protein ACFLQM_02825, partial [Acidobacteriota bacterium]